MANRRMFSMDVVDTDKFLDMPASSQNLYFHLGMRADDDGFVSSPKKITRLVNCSDADFDNLISSEYILQFDDGVIVIKHWKQNNYIQSDRYNKTIYQTEKNQLQILNNVYTLDTENVQTVSSAEAQVSIGKVSIGKVRDSINYQQIADMYNNTCVSFPRIVKLSESRKKAIKARLKNYTLSDFEKLFNMAESSSFLKGQNGNNWSATFDWMIKDSSMAKILEGNYKDRESPELDDREGYQDYDRTIRLLKQEGVI